MQNWFILVLILILILLHAIIYFLKILPLLNYICLDFWFCIHYFYGMSYKVLFLCYCCFFFSSSYSITYSFLLLILLLYAKIFFSAYSFACRFNGIDGNIITNNLQLHSFSMIYNSILFNCIIYWFYVIEFWFYAITFVEHFYSKFINMRSTLVFRRTDYNI